MFLLLILIIDSDFGVPFFPSLSICLYFCAAFGFLLLLLLVINVAVFLLPGPVTILLLP